MLEDFCANVLKPLVGLRHLQKVHLRGVVGWINQSQLL